MDQDNVPGGVEQGQGKNPNFQMSRLRERDEHSLSRQPQVRTGGQADSLGSGR